MSNSASVPEVLDREFLGIRARLIELAAALDRIDRAAGTASADPRLEKIRASLGILVGETADRAEQVQVLFSLPYKAEWRKEYGV